MNDTTGILYVIATPIGNLEDISKRAIDYLKQVHCIACEDTRTSAKLLQHYTICNKLVAYHDHNADTQTDTLITLLKNGKNVGLICDAGTPLISDPGYRLVKACHDNGIKVSGAPGVSAGIYALSVAGLPSDRFYFCGFLPAKSHARQTVLHALKHQTCTLIFYEAPHRILSSLDDMLLVFGNRTISYCRELTKAFETVRQSNIKQLISFIKDDPNQQKGEIVLVVAGYDKQDDHDISTELLEKLLPFMPLKKAVELASHLSGTNKNDVYKTALLLKNTQ